MAIDQLVIEMMYQSKGKQLSSMRRVAMNFRDYGLSDILDKMIKFNKGFYEQVSR